MTVIEHGKVPTKRFQCRHCGCIFDATRSEYRIAYYRMPKDFNPFYVDHPINVPVFCCDCPECDDEGFQKEEWENDNHE